jgi:ABC-2 type transport system permease protein
MNTWLWLIRREVWEHRGSVWRAPVIVMGVCLALTLMALPFGYAHLAAGHPQASDAQHAFQGIGGGLLLLPTLVMTICMFVYSASALSDERRDRSLLFWKSLPVSDTQTVLAKALLPLVVAPAVAIGVGLAGTLVMGTLCWLPGFPVLNAPAWTFFREATWGTWLIQGALMTVIYVLTALPTVGWLLACSAWSRRKPLLWAFLVPLLAWVAWVWLQGMGLPLPNVQPTLRHLLGGFWEVGRVHSVSDAWVLLTSVNLWWGVALGVMGLGTAIEGRRRQLDA